MSRQSEKELRLREAMAPLLNREGFDEWMQGILGNRERVLGEFEIYKTITEERVLSVAIAEMGLFDDIVAIYEKAHPGWEESLEKPRADGPPAEARFNAAMASLLGDVAFQSLMAFFRAEEKRERANMRTSKITSNALASIGRHGAIRAILASYRSHQAPVANQLVATDGGAEG